MLTQEMEHKYIYNSYRFLSVCLVTSLFNALLNSTSTRLVSWSHSHHQSLGFRSLCQLGAWEQNQHPETASSIFSRTVKERCRM